MKTATQMKKEEAKRLELKRKIREWTLNILLAALLTICIVAIGTSNRELGQPVQVIEHTVKQGENLDDIANKYYPTTYVLKARVDIKKLNNMTESDIYAGQTILVKVEVK